MSISTASSQVATLTRYRYVAAGSETSLSGSDANGNTLAYTVGAEQVYLNGVMLVRGQDYTASSGTSITSLTALAASDVVEILTFSPFTLANAVDQTLVDAKGDLIVGTADNTVTRVGIGTNNYVLTADSTQTSGVKWAAPGNNLTLTGTLTAGGSAGTNGYYLQTTGTGTQWAAVSGYSAPTLGSTSIASGATVTTINGLTKVQASQHTSLDADGYEQDITLMTLMGAWL